VSNSAARGPWKAASVRYAAVLRAEMVRTGTTPRQLATALGVSNTAVGYYCQARYLPRPEIAIAIADILRSEPLGKLATSGRIIRCAQCGRETIRGQTGRRYCSDACRARANRKGTPVHLSGIQAAVDAFCHECELEGVCRTPACTIQPFSPLPLARRKWA
jgi:DNA-binding XRE family transcriptional regulator